MSAGCGHQTFLKLPYPSANMGIKALVRCVTCYIVYQVDIETFKAVFHLARWWQWCWRPTCLVTTGLSTESIARVGSHFFKFFTCPKLLLLLLYIKSQVVCFAFVSLTLWPMHACDYLSYSSNHINQRMWHCVVFYTIQQIALTYPSSHIFNMQHTEKLIRYSNRCTTKPQCRIIWSKGKSVLHRLAWSHTVV